MGKIIVWAIIVAAGSIGLLLLIKNKRGKSTADPIEIMGILGITIISIPLLTYGLVSWLRTAYFADMNDLIFIFIIFISFPVAYKLAHWLSNKFD
ncbi:MAG: hypothetical protein HQ508_05070 [Candidatus Marinimicrobia bacterium]|nr:hypothetical protein [Candidatus Neomarinimicrobiota bacterium]